MEMVNKRRGVLHLFLNLDKKKNLQEGLPTFDKVTV